MIRYLFEGKVYKISVFTEDWKRAWKVELWDTNVRIDKGQDVHIADVMRDVDCLIREQASSKKLVNTNSLYDILQANHPRTKFGFL